MFSLLFDHRLVKEGFIQNRRTGSIYYVPNHDRDENQAAFLVVDGKITSARNDFEPTFQVLLIDRRDYAEFGLNQKMIDDFLKNEYPYLP